MKIVLGVIIITILVFVIPLLVDHLVHVYVIGG
jgi:hypothetical protein